MTIRPRTIAMFSAAVMSLAILLPAVHSPASASIASETSAFYEDALIRFDKNDYAGSIIQLRNVLQKDPTNLPARILLGRAQMRIGNAAAAEKELEIARKAGADEELIIEELAKSYLLQRKFSELLEKIKAGNRPPSVEALVLTARASANFEQHRFKVAMAEYDQAIKLAPERSAPLLGQARILIRQGNFAKAQSKVDIAQRLNPGYHDLWYVKGELHRVKNELEAAVLAYGKTISAIPGHLPARLKRAIVLIELGRPDEAIPDADYIRLFDPGDPQGHYLQYLIHKGAGDQRKAQASLRQADLIIRNFHAEYIRSHGPTLLLAGIVSHALDKLDEARFYLGEYIKLAPHHPGSRRMLGGLLIKQNRPERAVEVLQPNLVMVPNDWRSLALMGAALTRLGKPTEATRHLKLAVDVMPDRPILRTRLALSRLAGGQTSAAIDDLEIVLQQSPGAEKPSLLLGMVHLRLRQYSQAKDVAKGMLKNDGDSPEGHNLMGGALLASGDAAGVRESFEKALLAAPEYGPAQTNLAKLDIREGKPEDAKRRYEQMLRQNVQDIGPMVALALMAEKAGDLDQAIRWMEKVGSFKRKDPNSQIKLINLYHRAGRLEAAMVLAVRLKQEFASNLSVLAAVGGAELRTGAMETAAKTFRRMSNMRPDSARDLVRISFLQLDARDFEGAFNTLTRAVWVEPANMAAQREIVKLEIHMRKFDAAEKRTEDLRQSFPDSGIGEWLHGDVMMAKNNYVIAISDYQASIEKTGGNSKLATSIFLARNKANQGPAAIDGLEAWVKDHPKDLEAQRVLAGGYLSAGRLSQAITAHEKIIAVRPNDPRLLNNLAWLYHETGDTRALTFAQKAYKISPKSPSVTDTLGWILVQRGQAAQGLTLLRQANARAARDPRIRYHMAVALSHLSWLNESRKELERVVREAKKRDPELVEIAEKMLKTMGQ